jgi:hypothetical protein
MGGGEGARSGRESEGGAGRVSTIQKRYLRHARVWAHSGGIAKRLARRCVDVLTTNEARVCAITTDPTQSRDRGPMTPTRQKAVNRLDPQSAFEIFGLRTQPLPDDARLWKRAVRMVRPKVALSPARRQQIREATRRYLERKARGEPPISSIEEARATASASRIAKMKAHASARWARTSPERRRQIGEKIRAGHLRRRAEMRGA